MIRATPAAWRAARNILCVRLDSLGDVLMCTPAMRALRHGHADRRLTLWSSPGGARAAPFIDEVESVITYEAPWMKHSAAHGAGHDDGMVQVLAARRFDAAVIFTSYSQSALPAALACHLAGIALRIAHCRENPYRLLSDWVPDPEPDSLIRHEVQRQLDLVAQLGCEAAGARLSFRVRERDVETVRVLLQACGIGRGQRWVLMHPGASAASRRYPPLHWAEVLRTLVTGHDLAVVLTGERHERPLVEQIRAACRVPTHSFAGALDLGELGAAISLASVVVSNNTGPAHIAAAVGTPQVTIYALTNPQHTPWQGRSQVLSHDVPCRYCYKSVCPQGHHDCLEKLQPQQVVDAIIGMLDVDLPGSGSWTAVKCQEPARPADGMPLPPT